MVKMIYCLRRLPHLSRKEFLTYWHESHALLVKKSAGPLRIKRYVQSATMDNPLNELLQQVKGHMEPFDGVAELWWESMEDLQAGAGTSEGAQAQNDLFTDEGKFIDFARSCSWFTEEKPVVG